MPATTTGVTATSTSENSGSGTPWLAASCNRSPAQHSVSDSFLKICADNARGYLLECLLGLRRKEQAAAVLLRALLRRVLALPDDASGAVALEDGLHHAADVLLARAALRPQHQSFR